MSEELAEIIGAPKDPRLSQLPHEAWISAEMATDPGETLLAAAWGSIDGMGSGCIGITNRRILLTPGFISGIGFSSGNIDLRTVRAVTPGRDNQIAIDCGSSAYTLHIGYEKLEAFDEVLSALRKVVN